jgi:Rne/Rng family ribonuclease
VIGRARYLLIAPEGIALLERGRVEDLILTPPAGDLEPSPGDIFRARVIRLVPNSGGAFVSLGAGRNGYLREAHGLGEGASILVQVTAHAEPGKACPVDRRIVVKGPRIMLTPGVPGLNVSRQIRNQDERARLIMALGGPDPARDPGIVVRTAAQDASEDVLVAERDRLLAELERIESAPGLEPSALLRLDLAGIAIRDWTSPAPHDTLFSEAVIQARGLAEWERSAVEFFTTVTDPDLFHTFGVWDEIEKLKSPRVELPSGARMAVEATRAMITVDVNTAGEFGGGASLTANLEAARELPRQLRLRGLGGQVTIDFAPLKKSGRKRIEDALKTSFRRDPVETTLAGWTPLGNFELQRKRERRPLTELVARTGSPTI